MFFAARLDGVVEAWDLCAQQSDSVLQHKVTDAALSVLAAEQSGRLVAVGDADGSLSLLQCDRSLAVPQPNEKSVVQEMLERETFREKALRSTRLATERKDKAAAAATAAELLVTDKDEKVDELLRKVDANFLAMIKETEEDEGKGLREELTIEEHLGIGDGS